jgi:N-acetylmuramoyl-L-alanine amidase
MLAFALAAKPLVAAQNGKSSTSQSSRTQSAAPKSSASYLSIPTLASSINMDVRKTSDGKRLHYTVSSKWCTLEFDEGKRICKVNGVQIQLSSEILQQRGALYISNSDYRKMIEPLILPQDFKPVPKLKVIMIDPGHGGNDSGAENKTLKIKEKLITLDLALKLKDELEDRGYTVYLTRNKDVYPDLEERPAMANKKNADLFISLHFNAASDSSVHGAETYILPPLGQASSTGNEGDGQVIAGNKFDAWNVIAGYYVQRELSRSVGTADRGLRRARFAVLRPLQCPGMLIESGYVSNPGECYKLSNATYRRKLADSIADAVDAYGKTLKRISDSQ